MIYKNYFQQLRQAIQLLMKENDIPGFSISVSDKEKVIFHDAYGFTDLSENFPVTTTTQFSLQSISKMYTAFGFMLAIQDGKVSLDEPIKKYVPDFFVRHKDGQDHSSSVTFRQCLTHRTGLKHEAPMGSNYVYTGTYEEHIKSINGTFLRYKPGERYSYSNLGIDLVAYALSRIYGMPFEEYMEERVFVPLDMMYSSYKQGDYLACIESAVGHGKEPLAKNPIMMIGAGGMYSCPNDMTHFIRCFLNKGIYNAQRFIDHVILEQMYDEYPPSDEWPYNLGLVAGFVKGRRILNHNGGGFGFLAAQDIAVDNGLGAAALTNSVEHPNIHLMIIRNMWEDLFALQDEKKDDCEHISDRYMSLIGLYEANFNGGSWKLAVIPRNGALYCNKQKLESYSENIFFTEKNDHIEFFEDAMRYDNVMLYKQNEEATPMFRTPT